MVVRLDEGTDAVRAYVAEQAAQGLEHVTKLVRDDRDAMIAMIGDLTEDEARLKPGADEFSVKDVLEHLNPSFAGSEARLRSLSQGQPFVWSGPPARSGGLPVAPADSYAAVRDEFIAGENAIVAVLEAASPDAPTSLTADHADYGPFNWLEWATYSHHVHTSDHIGQVRALRQLILSNR